VAKLVARLLATAALWVRIQTSQAHQENMKKIKWLKNSLIILEEEQIFVVGR
jgi:hypothetical protein